MYAAIHQIHGSSNCFNVPLQRQEPFGFWSYKQFGFELFLW